MWKVRLATAADLPALAVLLREMDAHYDGSAALGEAAVRSALERHVFAAGSGIEIHVAEADGRLLGFASLSLLFPADPGASWLFLKELYVAADVRSQGVGLALMQAVARRAVARGCGRINWNADRSNAGALAFYQMLGARIRDDVVMLSLDGEAMTRLAAEDGGD